MLPFTVVFKPGIPAYTQVAFAARKAIVAGVMKPGDRFPSVRTLSQALKINPNTAHKVVSGLKDAGLLEVRPGIGTVVSAGAIASVGDTTQLLGDELERVAVEARQLGLSFEEVAGALKAHWDELEPASVVQAVKK